VGTFPIHIETQTLIAAGAVSLNISPTGRVDGYVSFPGAVLQGAPVSGRFRATRGRETLSLRVGGRRATFTSALKGAQFVGTFAHKGSLLVGSGTFSIDVSTATPLMVAVGISVRGGFGAIRRGLGSLSLEPFDGPVGYGNEPS